MSTTDLIAARNLLLAFYNALDEGRFQDAAQNFLDTGEWHRQGDVLTGPQQVGDAYAGRDATQRTRHVITNLLLGPAPYGLDFSLNITLFAGKAAEGDVPVVSGPAMVLTSHGHLSRAAGTWKILRKQTDRQFMIQSRVQ